MAGNLAAHLHQPGGFHCRVDGQLANAVDHVAQLALKAVMPGGQLADFVVSVHRHILRQIARAFTVLVQQGGDFPQGVDNQVAQIRHPDKHGNGQQQQACPNPAGQRRVIQLPEQIGSQ